VERLHGGAGPRDVRVSPRRSVRVLLTSIRVAAGRINIVTGGINAITGWINTATGGINTVTGWINTMTSGIYTLTSWINTMTGRINTLTGRIEPGFRVVGMVHHCSMVDSRINPCSIMATVCVEIITRHLMIRSWPGLTGWYVDMLV